MSVSYELMVFCPIIIRTPLVLLYSNRRVSFGGVSVYPVLQGGESTEPSGQEDAGHTALGTGTGKEQDQEKTYLGRLGWKVYCVVISCSYVCSG